MDREILTRSATETLELGERLGKLLEPGDVVALVGPLGVGKTVLAKGIGRGLGVKEEVLSPSFNIVLSYTGRLTFRHVDFYRLSAAKEAYDIGIEEYLDSDAVTVVEWADRLPDVLPSEHLFMEMEFRGDDRVFGLRPKGSRYEKLLSDLFKAMKKG